MAKAGTEYYPSIMCNVNAYKHCTIHIYIYIFIYVFIYLLEDLSTDMKWTVSSKNQCCKNVVDNWIFNISPGAGLCISK